MGREREGRRTSPRLSSPMVATSARISSSCSASSLRAGSKVSEDSRFPSREREESLVRSRTSRTTTRKERRKGKGGAREREGEGEERREVEGVREGAGRRHVARVKGKRGVPRCCKTMEGMPGAAPARKGCRGGGVRRGAARGGAERSGAEETSGGREKRHVVRVDAIRAGDRTQCLWLSSLTRESLTNVLLLPTT